METSFLPPIRAIHAAALLCLLPGGAGAVSVLTDDLASSVNLSSSTNLSWIQDPDSLTLSGTSVPSASVVWNQAGANFDLTGGQFFRFFWTAYQFGNGINLTDVAVRATYNDPGATTLTLGSSNLFLLVASGDIGNYAVPVVPGATGFSIRLDFTTSLGSPTGGVPGQVTLDQLSIVPEPGTAVLAAAGIAGSLRRRRA